METAKKFKGMDFGFQGHFYRPPSPLHRSFEDLKIDDNPRRQLRFPEYAKEKSSEETDSRFKDIQYRFDI